MSRDGQTTTTTTMPATAGPLVPDGTPGANCDYVIRLRPVASAVAPPPEVRLRKLLKDAERRWLRCVEVGEVPGDGRASE